MGFLNREWALNYIFYFCDVPPGGQVLVITDHAARTEIDFQLFDMKLDFCLPDYVKNEVKQKKDLNIKFFDSGDFTIPEKKYGLIIFDLEMQSYKQVFVNALNYLEKDGAVVIFDWSLSVKQMLKKSFWHLGISGKHDLGISKKTEYKISGIPLKLDWYFFLEPDLHKPHNLARQAFITSIPQNSKSGIKNLLNKYGAFYLRPHNKVIISRRSDIEQAASPVIRIIKALAEKSGIDNLINEKSIRQIRISRTKVLMLDLDLEKDKYIVRFPLGKPALARLLKQQEILTLLNSEGITAVPAPFKLQEDLPFNCFIEEKIAGAVNQKALTGNKGSGIISLNNQIYPEIEKIHNTFGSLFKMDESSFNKYVEPKLSILGSAVKNNNKSVQKVDKIRTCFRKEFNNKTFMAGVCHGDLKIQNCIYDSTSKLKGLIDWDMSEKDEITIMDAASLLVTGIRTKHYKRENLRAFMLAFKQIPDAFLEAHKKYFNATGTTYLKPKILILFYWVDRVDKLLRYRSHINDEWITKEIKPVLNRIDYFTDN